MRMHHLIEVRMVEHDFAMSVSSPLISGGTIARMQLAIGRAFDLHCDQLDAIDDMTVAQLIKAIDTDLHCTMGAQLRGKLLEVEGDDGGQDWPFDECDDPRRVCQHFTSCFQVCVSFDVPF